MLRLLILNRFENINDPYDNATNANVIDTSTINDPLRDGASKFSEGIWWIKKGGIDSFVTAKDGLLASIQVWTNRLLWFLALIALVYLIIQWVQFLFSPKDDNIKKITGRITNTLWALWWIGLSRVIISALFYLVNMITK